MDSQRLALPDAHLRTMAHLLQTHGLDPAAYRHSLMEFRADFGPVVRVLNLEGPVSATYCWTEDGTWLEAMKGDLEAGLYQE